MERFIGYFYIADVEYTINLKSSMERFIDIRRYLKTPCFLFKIQYGEIYSKFRIFQTHRKRKFKIQYGEIYRQVDMPVTSNILSFKIQYGEIYRDLSYDVIAVSVYLKSSMERFIAIPQELFSLLKTNLKSSMERFIDLDFFARPIFNII